MSHATWLSSSVCHRKARTTRGFSARLFRFMRRRRRVLSPPLDSKAGSGQMKDWNGARKFHDVVHKFVLVVIWVILWSVSARSAYRITSAYSIAAFIWPGLLPGCHTLNGHGHPPLCGTSLSSSGFIMQDPPSSVCDPRLPSFGSPSPQPPSLPDPSSSIHSSYKYLVIPPKLGEDAACPGSQYPCRPH